MRQNYVMLTCFWFCNDIDAILTLFCILSPPGPSPNLRFGSQPLAGHGSQTGARGAESHRRGTRSNGGTAVAPGRVPSGTPRVGDSCRGGPDVPPPRPSVSGVDLYPRAVALGDACRGAGGGPGPGRRAVPQGGPGRWQAALALQANDVAEMGCLFVAPVQVGSRYPPWAWARGNRVPTPVSLARSVVV